MRKEPDCPGSLPRRSAHFFIILHVVDSTITVSRITVLYYHEKTLRASFFDAPGDAHRFPQRLSFEIFFQKRLPVYRTYAPAVDTLVMLSGAVALVLLESVARELLRISDHHPVSRHLRDD